MEQFVRAILAGGVALLAGLWLTTLAGVASLPWLAGVVLVGCGVLGLGFGIGTELDV